MTALWVRASFWGDENVLEADRSRLNATSGATFKVSFTLCEFYLNERKHCMEIQKK